MAGNTERATAVVDVDGKQAGNELKNLETKAAGLKKQLIELGKANNKAGFDKKKKELSAVNKQMKGLKKETFDATKVLKNLNGTSLKDLIRAEKQLNKETAGLTRGTQKYIQKSKQLKTVRNEIRKTKKSMGGAGTGVTQLSGAWTGAMGSMGSSTMIFTAALNGARMGVRLLSLAFKSLKAAIISTGIGALVIGIVALIQYFSRTEEGAAKLRIMLAPLKVLFQNILDIIGNLGGDMVEAFEQPESVIKKLGDIIKNNFLNRIEGIKAIGPALVKIFKGDIKEGLLELGDANLQVITGIEKPIQTIVKVSKKAQEEIIKIAEETKREAKIAQQIERSKLALSKMTRKFNEENAEKNARVQELRLIAADKENVSAEERLQALQDANKLTEEIFANERILAAERLANKTKENALAQSTKEDLDEESRLKVELFNLDAQQAKQLKRIKTEEVTTAREVEAEKKAIADAEKKRKEEEIKAEEEFQKERLSIREKYELVSAEELQRMEMEKLQKAYDDKLLTEEEFQQAKFEVIDKYRKLDEQKDQDSRDKQLQAIRDQVSTAEALTAAFSDLKGTLLERDLKAAEGNAEKEKAIRKKYALFEFALTTSQIIADTASAIVAALKLPPPAGEIAAVTRGATGALQLGIAAAEISKVNQFFKGKYDVIGVDDGRKYSANFQGFAETGIASNPSLYLAGEKGPEMIIDNPTLKNMQMNFPGLIDAIKSAKVPQFANGNVDAFSVSGNNQELLSAVSRLNVLLAGPIKAQVAYTDIEEAEGRVTYIKNNANIQ